MFAISWVSTLQHILRVGPGLPHLLDRCVEDAGNDEVAFRVGRVVIRHDHFSLLLEDVKGKVRDTWGFYHPRALQFDRLRAQMLEQSHTPTE